jgi:RimJ/RimL family protein N-acetyltransferase
MNDVSLRPANLDDTQALFEWRNDPMTQAMSLNTDELDFATHERWFNGALKRKNCLILIAHVNINEPAVGMIRFDIDSNHCLATISLNLSSQSRGRGLAVRCLKQAIEVFRHRYENCELVLAQIKSNNIGSIKSFERAGFVLVNGVNDGEPNSLTDKVDAFPLNNLLQYTMSLSNQNG